MQVLITGAAGFLGRGLVVPFERAGGYTLRLMDIVDFESPHQTVRGDVSDLPTVLEAAEGMDAIVVAHMAPNRPEVYETPTQALDVNVKGTANLFYAAREKGIGKVVLISSQAAIRAHGEREVYPHDLPPCPGEGHYCLSKGLQEMIAEQHARTCGISVAVLRVGYILDGDNNVDKYGRSVGQRAAPDTDRRDIGEVARRCLELTDLTYETLHVMSTPESMREWDVQYTCRRLGWEPEYDFSWLKEPQED